MLEIPLKDLESLREPFIKSMQFTRSKQDAIINTILEGQKANREKKPTYQFYTKTDPYKPNYNVDLSFRQQKPINNQPSRMKLIINQQVAVKQEPINLLDRNKKLTINNWGNLIIQNVLQHWENSKENYEEKENDAPKDKFFSTSYIRNKNAYASLRTLNVKTLNLANKSNKMKTSRSYQTGKSDNNLLHKTIMNTDTDTDERFVTESIATEKAKNFYIDFVNVNINNIPTSCESSKKLGKKKESHIEVFTEELNLDYEKKEKIIESENENDFNDFKEKDSYNLGPKDDKNKSNAYKQHLQHAKYKSKISTSNQQKGRNTKDIKSTGLYDNSIIKHKSEIKRTLDLTSAAITRNINYKTGHFDMPLIHLFEN